LDGWYREAACTTPWNFASDTVTADRTLYAKWTSTAVYDTADFGGYPDGSYTVSNKDEWDAAWADISTGFGNEYVINVEGVISGNISVDLPALVILPVVSIRGSGEIYKDSGSGPALHVGATEKFILRGPTIRGYSGCTSPLVTVDMMGTFVMESGRITGGGAGGVELSTTGTFTINGSTGVHTSMVTGNSSFNVQKAFLGTINGTTGASAGW
jgi:uncharacterized repeat protein (TIGR02543 family)